MYTFNNPLYFYALFKFTFTSIEYDQKFRISYLVLATIFSLFALKEAGWELANRCWLWSGGRSWPGSRTRIRSRAWWTRSGPLTTITGSTSGDEPNSATRRGSVEGLTVSSIQTVGNSRRVVGNAEIDADVVGEAASTVIGGDERGRRVGVRCADQAAIGHCIAEANAEQVVGAAGAARAVYRLDSRIGLPSGTNVKAVDL